MSVRGPRGGRGRGRGRGFGRGRGRGKTIVWEWENYTPGPEVFDQLWHIRKEPATVTPFLPTQCPISNAQTRITDRRQTEGDIQRNFYVVEVTYFQARENSVASEEDVKLDRTEIVHVDLSRIMEYVSPDELERYENEQFKLEAEAEVIAMRAEAEETAKRRLEKNARLPGAGKGSRMLNGLGLGTAVRARGRPRGRGRGRGRGSWRGRGALALSGQLRDEDMEEQLVDAEDDILQRDEEVQLMIAETDSEEEEMLVDAEPTSPGLARSAFVANSALPVSPVAPIRRPSGIPIIQRARREAAHDDSDLELADTDTRSMSSAAMQLRIGDDVRDRSHDTSEDESSDGDRHRSKRRRTESTASNQHIRSTKATLPMHEAQRPYSQTSLVPSIRESSSVTDADSNESIPPQPPSNIQPNGTDHDAIHVHLLPHADPLVEQHNEEDNDDEEEDAAEYVVEDIIEHYRKAGKKYYLVKWQGYEDSYDWLPEEDLEGAAELVVDYNERIRRKKEKQKSMR